MLSHQVLKLISNLSPSPYQSTGAALNAKPLDPIANPRPLPQARHCEDRNRCFKSAMGRAPRLFECGSSLSCAIGQNMELSTAVMSNPKIEHAGYVSCVFS